MTLDEYRTTYAWKSSLELAPHLIRIAEQLPEAETNGLGASLRTVSAQLPGAIAADLLIDGSHRAPVTMLQTVATLEVVERVYPALDTAAARSAADALAERVLGPNFADHEDKPAPANAESLETMVEPVPLAEQEAAALAATPPAAPTAPEMPSPVLPVVAAAPVTEVPLAPPISVPLTPAPAPEALAAPANVAPVTPVSIPVVNEVASVHPDSPQQAA